MPTANDPQLYPDTPTISLKGTIRYDSAVKHSEVPLSAALEKATWLDTVVTLAAGALAVAVVAPAPNADVMVLDTPRKVRYRVNGGVENFEVSRLRLDFGTDITSLEFDNNQLDPAEAFDVTISWGYSDEAVT